MRQLTSLLTLLSTLVVATLAGCSLTGWGRPATPPTLTLVASIVTSLSASEITATVVVAISNPNADPVRVGAVRYRLTFPGGETSRGSVSAHTAVPADGEITVELPVKISVQGLLPEAGPMLLTGELPYDLDASARVGTPLIGGDIQLSTSSALRLDLPLELVRPAPAPAPPPRFAFAGQDWQRR